MAYRRNYGYRRRGYRSYTPRRRPMGRGYSRGYSYRARPGYRRRRSYQFGGRRW